ncbi:RraA-like protein [Mollisia scopiformis]|uniref:RraA-like protein n=1 Tax=Mollisia scopiformis TaxID=149040 RepID=A0A132B5N2_MOLSC|nr:RraA-like protein [Mollisia scopiformis]KUJ07651.1 RraA-like protein [Mollisia scopiformis]
MTASRDPIVQELQSFSTCDVSDALLKLKYPHGGFLSDLTLWSPERQMGETKIIGPAYTVKYVSVNDKESPKHTGHYIDTIPSGSVVFVSSPKTVNAVYGGLMSNRAQVSGAVGTIVDGRVRDLQEHRDLKYPVFARDIGTASPYEVVRVSSINTTVKLQSTEQDASIKPGDYLIGDLNGVVCLPREFAEKAIALMAPQVEADLKIAEDIRKGMTFVEASKKHRSGIPKP